MRFCVIPRDEKVIMEYIRVKTLVSDHDGAGFGRIFCLITDVLLDVI